MSLSYGLLGLLAQRPASGYDLSRQFKDVINVVWPASHPQIYGALHQLAAQGFVVAGADGKRGKKIYEITPAGLAELKKWLSHGSVDHTLRSESLLRSLFFDLMEPEELQKHLAAEAEFFASRVRLYEQYALAKDRGDHGRSPHVASLRIAVEAGVRLYAALAEWAVWAKQRSK